MIGIFGLTEVLEKSNLGHGDAFWASQSRMPQSSAPGPYRAFIIASNAVVQLRENGHSSFAQHARLAEVRVADEV